MAWTPNRKPIYGIYCGGGNWGDNVQGLEPLLLTTPKSSIFDPALALAEPVTNRFCYHMPQGWLEFNTYGVAVTQVLVPALTTYFEENLGVLASNGWDIILYTGTRMPKVAGVAVQDAASQATGPEDGTLIAIRPEDIDWYVESCIDLFGIYGAKQLWLDAYIEAQQYDNVDTIEQKLASLGWMPQTVGQEALPLEIGPSGLPSDNTIIPSLITKRPHLFLERNYGRTFDPNNVWEFDPATTEVHVVIDDEFSFWTEEEGIERLNDFVRRGMIVSIFGGTTSWAYDWWVDQYTPKQWLWNIKRDQERIGTQMPKEFQVFTYEFPIAASQTRSVVLRSTAGGMSIYKHKITGDDTKFDDTKIKAELRGGGTFVAGSDVSANWEVVQGGSTASLEARFVSGSGDGSNVIDVEFLNGAARGGENVGLTLAQGAVAEYRFTAPAGLTGTTNIALTVSIER